MGGSGTNGGDQESSQVPETVVDGSDGASVLRVADLGEKQGRRHLGEGVTETEDETTTEVHLVSVGKGSDATASNHEGAAGGDGGPTAVGIGDVRGDEEGDDGTNVEHVDQDTKLVVILDGNVEELLPLIDLLRDVEQTSVVASRGRGNHENSCAQVQLAQMRLLVPDDMLEPGCLSLSYLELGGASADADVGSHDDVKARGEAITMEDVCWLLVQKRFNR